MVIKKTTGTSARTKKPATKATSTTKKPATTTRKKKPVEVTPPTIEAEAIEAEAEVEVKINESENEEKKGLLEKTSDDDNNSLNSLVTESQESVLSAAEPETIVQLKEPKINLLEDSTQEAQLTEALIYQMVHRTNCYYPDIRPAKKQTDSTVFDEAGVINFLELQTGVSIIEILTTAASRGYIVTINDEKYILE